LWPHGYVYRWYPLCCALPSKLLVCAKPWRRARVDLPSLSMLCCDAIGRAVRGVPLDPTVLPHVLHAAPLHRRDVARLGSHIGRRLVVEHRMLELRLSGVAYDTGLSVLRGRIL